MGDTKMVAFSIRIPEELKKQIEAAAKEDNRTTNNMIMCILQAWIKENKKD